MPVVYFFRHGETDFNVAQRLQGRCDTSLNARGRRQADEIANLLRELLTRDGRRPEDFAYISSPLKRACETIELVRGNLGLVAEGYARDDRLMEIAYGEWEGLTLREIAKRNPGILARRDRDKWDFAPEGGESYRDVAQRVGAWYATIERDTVTAAHGGVARVLMANLGIVPQDQAPFAEVRQGVVYVFSGSRLARYA